jgi:hypothetical protein
LIRASISCEGDLSFGDLVVGIPVVLLSSSCDPRTSLTRSEGEYKSGRPAGKRVHGHS